MTTSIMPLSDPVLARRAELRAQFVSDFPLPGFAIIQDFLAADVLQEVLQGCVEAEYATFCGYSPSGRPDDVRNEFFEPQEGLTYVTIHQRAVHIIPQIERLHEWFVSPETLRAMTEITGVDIGDSGHSSVLTHWGPWSFIEPHADAGEDEAPNRLAISLSLTSDWDQHWGGATTFAWGTPSRRVTLSPKLNTAVLFAPFSGSYHWVDQVAGDAPERKRFTWTMLYK